ncbi:MAG: hypothetical protein HQL65_12475 [Magnetococcales bacterium]|nr:hypothetical protein [Magnetococcales bacterium]MBF0155220.1 hypothetical protein [Magnetococcales bacterium]
MKIIIKICKIALIIIILTLFCIALLIRSCDDFVSRDEILRLTSPDQQVDAVMVEINAGATTAYVYKVYLMPTGKKPVEHDKHVFGATHLDDWKIKWLDSNRVVIIYSRADIFHYTNYKDIQLFHPIKGEQTKRIEILLR